MRPLETFAVMNACQANLAPWPFPADSWKMGFRQMREERFIRINFQKPINYAYILQITYQN